MAGLISSRRSIQTVSFLVSILDFAASVSLNPVENVKDTAETYWNLGIAAFICVIIAICVVIILICTCICCCCYHCCCKKRRKNTATTTSTTVEYHGVQQQNK